MNVRTDKEAMRSATNHRMVELAKAMHDACNELQLVLSKPTMPVSTQITRQRFEQLATVMLIHYRMEMEFSLSAFSPHELCDITL